MELTATNVDSIFRKCLFEKGEQVKDYKEVQGIMANFALHPDRLKENEFNIINFLNQLPEEYMKGKGGGWSFLNMCMDHEGRQWCDLHQTMEQLVVLGIGIGKMQYLMPPALWPSLPGGMPYIMITP